MSNKCSICNAKHTYTQLNNKYRLCIKCYDMADICHTLHIINGYRGSFLHFLEWYTIRTMDGLPTYGNNTGWPK